MSKIKALLANLEIMKDDLSIENLDEYLLNLYNIQKLLVPSNTIDPLREKIHYHTVTALAKSIMIENSMKKNSDNLQSLINRNINYIKRDYKVRFEEAK